jgi:hypothetical protein
MRRVIVFALPFLFVGALVVAALALRRRRTGRPLARPRVETGGTVEREAHDAGNARAGVEVLVGHDEQHEEDEETRHGALLHIDVGKLSVGQF